MLSSRVPAVAPGKQLSLAAGTLESLPWLFTRMQSGKCLFHVFFKHILRFQDHLPVLFYLIHHLCVILLCCWPLNKYRVLWEELASSTISYLALSGDGLFRVSPTAIKAITVVMEKPRVISVFPEQYLFRILLNISSIIGSFCVLPLCHLSFCFVCLFVQPLLAVIIFSERGTQEQRYNRPLG